MKTIIISLRNFTLVLAFSSSAVAQTVIDDLGVSVVTASRVEESVLDSTASVSLIDESELTDYATRTIPDALRYSSGILIQKTTHAQGSPFIRGFTGRQNLLLVDGVRLNNSTFRSGPIQYLSTLDANAVSKLELVKGPQSTLYGSDALGGTLNILSKDTSYKDEIGAYYGGSAYYRYETNSSSHIGRLEQRFGVGGKYGIQLGVSAKDFGDIKDSSVGRMAGTGYYEEAFDLKFEYVLNPTTQFTFAHQYLNQDDVQRYHRLTTNPGWINGNHITEPGQFLNEDLDQERSLTYLRFDGESDHLFFRDWQTTLSFQKSQDSTFRRETGLSTRSGNIDTETYGFAFQGSGDIRDGELVWGLDFYHDEVDSEGSEPRRRPVADDSSYDTLGVFAQYQYNINDKLKVSTGVRYSYFRADYGESFDSSNSVILGGTGDWDDFSFNLGVNYRMGDRYALFGGVSQGFRAPNLSDLTGSSSALSGVDEIGSTDLDPEDVLSFELGLKRETSTVSHTASVFYTFIEDPITSEVDGNTLQLQNGNDGYIFGAEVEGKWNFGQDWSLRGSLTWQDGKRKLNDGTEDTISRLAPFSGTLAVKWTHPSDKYWIEGSVIGAAAQDNLSSRDLTDDQRIPTNGTPGYLVSSLNAGYQFNESLQLNLSLQNLTDEDYRVHGSGNNETGFNTTLGVKYTW